MSIEAITGQFGGGALIGFIVGVIMKKLLIVVAMFAALGIAGLGYIESRGVFNVNWEVFNAGGATEAASTVAQTIVGIGTELILNFLLSIPAGAGFTGGALIGFTRG